MGKIQLNDEAKAVLASLSANQHLVMAQLMQAVAEQSLNAAIRHMEGRLASTHSVGGMALVEDLRRYGREWAAVETVAVMPPRPANLDEEVRVFLFDASFRKIALTSPLTGDLPDWQLPGGVGGKDISRYGALDAMLRQQLGVEINMTAPLTTRVVGHRRITYYVAVPESSQHRAGWTYLNSAQAARQPQWLDLEALAQQFDAPDSPLDETTRKVILQVGERWGYRGDNWYTLARVRGLDDESTT